MSPSGRKSRVEKTELRTRRLLQELISLRCPALYTLILKRENPCPLNNNESPATLLKPDFLMEPNFAKLVKAILRLAGGGYPTVFPSEYRQERPRHAAVQKVSIDGPGGTISAEPHRQRAGSNRKGQNRTHGAQFPASSNHLSRSATLSGNSARRSGILIGHGSPNRGQNG